MSIRDDSFSVYISEIKLDPSGPLYHDWLYDRLFKGEDVSEVLKKKIRRAIHEGFMSGCTAGGIHLEKYFENLYKKVKVPDGEFKGQFIYSLPNKPETVHALNDIRQKSKSDLVRKACEGKIKKAQISIRLSNEYIESKTRNRRRRRQR
jgi:hypothetical protein